jgi:large subunit ribosomal protein L20
MTRTKRGITAKQRHQKITSLTKGFVGSHSKLYRTANQQMMKSLRYSYNDRRKKKKREKSIWMVRINAWAKKLETNYNRFIYLCRRASVLLNSKISSEMGRVDDLSLSFNKF